MEGRWRWRFAFALIGITTLSVTLSWLAFRFFNLPLPMTRTGIFLLPLCTLAAGAIGAGPARSQASLWLRRGISVAFVGLACYFLLCLRFSYFKEYEDEAEVKDVYSLLAKLNHTSGVKDVISTGLYVNSLNFYRVQSGRETFPEFQYFPVDALPTGKSIYVLHGPYYQDFIKREELEIVYRGKFTPIVVAVRSPTS
jgi:hypothetical protein